MSVMELTIKFYQWKKTVSIFFILNKISIGMSKKDSLFTNQHSKAMEIASEITATG